MEDTAKLYNKYKNGWPQDDPWHNYTKKIITDYIEKKVFSNKSYILNLGSGGTTYNINGNFFHVDIAKETISHHNRYKVGTAENIPYESNKFDICICVGSVINYCNAEKVLAEIKRVLKNDGLLILEYERSDSAEFIFTKEYKLPTFKKNYLYYGDKHILNLFSDKHIENFIQQNLFIVVDKKYFHSISSIIYRITKKNNFSAKFSFLDIFLNETVKKYFSHNCILTLKINH